MIARYSLVVAFAGLAAACGSGDDDLKSELNAMTRDFRGRVEPVARWKEPPEFKFDIDALPDPFHPSTTPSGIDPAARRDRMLLARYSSAAEIDEARERAAKDLQTAMKDSEYRLAQMRKRFASLEKEVDFYKDDRTGKSKASRIPAALGEDLERTRLAIGAEEALVAARRVELEGLAARFEEDKKRLAQLKAKRK